MSALLVLIATLFTLVCLAVGALVHGRRRQTVHASDWVLLLAPAPLFFATAVLFNQPAHIGWALVLWPFLVFAIGVLSLCVRLLALPLLGLPGRVTAAVFSAFILIGAALWGAWVPPWYD